MTKQYQDKGNAIYDSKNNCWIPKDLGNRDYVEYLTKTGLLSGEMCQEIGRLAKVERIENITRHSKRMVAYCLLILGSILIVVGLLGLFL